MVRFTIITCTYNAAEELPRTLQSVLEQSYLYVEHLIVDGASKDNTLSVLEEYQRKNEERGGEHIVHVVSEPDRGLYDAMNKALKLADGDFVLFLNAGDSLHEKDTLGRVAEVVESVDTVPAVVYGDTHIVNASGEYVRNRRLCPPERLTWKSFRKGMLVCHQAFFASTRLTGDCPYNNEEYRFSADFDWCIRLLRMAARKGMTVLNAHVVVADYQEGGMTEKNHWKSLKERFRIMVRHYGCLSTILYHAYFVVRAIVRK